MKLSQIPEVLGVLRKARVTPFLWGHHGIGKSSVIHQYGAKLGIPVIDLRLALMEPGDLLGLADLSGGTTKFARPSWLPTSGEGILFLDEFNRARRDMLNAAFQLVLDRRVGEYELPPGWFVVAAGNAGDDYVVADLADSALLSRFCHVKVEPDSKEAVEYLAGKAGTNAEATSFVQFLRETGLQDKVKDFSIAEFVKPDNRAREVFGRVLAANSLGQSLQRELGYGLIGVEKTEEYFSWLASQDKALTYDEIVTDGFKAKARKRLQKAVEAARMDYLGACNEALVEGLKLLKEAKDVPKGLKDVLMEYSEALPRDVAVGMLINAFKFSPGVIEALGSDADLKKFVVKLKGAATPAAGTGGSETKTQKAA